MKNNKVLYIVLGVILFVLLGSSVYINFIAKDSTFLSYILLVQIMLGVASAIVTLFLCKNKKSHQVLFISFLEVLFSLSIVTLNTIHGYNKVLNVTIYSEYMEYVSMIMNIYIFIIFSVIIGLLSLSQFIKYKLEVKEN